MKPASPALQSLLSTGQFFSADLYTFALADGVTLIRLTSADVDITDPNGPRLFSAHGPLINRGKTTVKVGLEVDTLQLDIYPHDGDSVGGVPWLAFAQGGGLDGAEVTLERAFMANWGDLSAGTVVLFAGRVGDVEMGRSTATITVNSHLELLSLQMPRNYYQTQCNHSLFDTGCGLNRAGFAVAGAITGSSTALNMVCGITQGPDAFRMGRIAFTSGANLGLTRSVKDSTTGLIVLMQPLPHIPVVGDTFTVWPGCDKSPGTCQTRFNNLGRFRGFPYIPVPEIAE